MQENAELVNEFLAPHLLWEMLKFQVGQTMWCPRCKRIMDCQNAVCVDVHKVENDALVYTKVFCANCFDATIAIVTDEAMSQTLGYPAKLRVVDGRDWDDEELYDPPRPVVGETITLKVARRFVEGGEVITGNLVDLALIDWGQFVVYQRQDTKNKLWHTVEARTGYGVSSGTSQAEAIRNAWRRLRKAGKEDFMRNLQKVPVLNPELDDLEK